MIRQFFAAAAAVICITSAAVPAAASKKSNAKALAVLKRAIAISNIEAKGSPAFRLQAEVHVFNGLGEANGLVLDFWAPGGKWRTETMITGYNRVRAGNKKETLWVKRSTKYAPYPVEVIWQTLNFTSDLQSVVHYTAHAKKAKLKLRLRHLKEIASGRKRPGRKKRLAKCVGATGGRNSVYCFDYVSGHLVQESNDSSGLRYVYGNYQPFETKSFPHTMRVFYSNGKEMLEVDVTEIDRLPKPSPKLFEPVAGAKKLTRGRNCLGTPKKRKVTQAKLVREVMPIYSEKAKRAFISGTVLLYAVIGTKGYVQSLWPLKSPSPLLTSSAMAAVRQWRYQATRLCGKPVPVDTFIRVVYTLGGP